MRACIVRGCTVTSNRFFEFPLRVWLSVSGNEDLLKLRIDQIRRKTFCEVHFENKYFLSKKLSNTAVPTLNLPENINVSSFFEKTPPPQKPMVFNFDSENWPTPAEACKEEMESLIPQGPSDESSVDLSQAQEKMILDAWEPSNESSRSNPQANDERKIMEREKPLALIER